MGGRVEAVGDRLAGRAEVFPGGDPAGDRDERAAAVDVPAVELEPVAGVAAGDAVKAGIRAHDIQVVAGAAFERVVVQALAAFECVGTRTAEQPVVAGAAFEPVVACVALEPVVARQALQRVIAAARVEVIAQRVVGAREQLGRITAKDHALHGQQVAMEQRLVDEPACQQRACCVVGVTPLEFHHAVGGQPGLADLARHIEAQQRLQQQRPITQPRVGAVTCRKPRRDRLAIGLPLGKFIAPCTLQHRIQRRLPRRIGTAQHQRAQADQADQRAEVIARRVGNCRAGQVDPHLAGEG